LDALLNRSTAFLGGLSDRKEKHLTHQTVKETVGRFAQPLNRLFRRFVG